MDSSIVDEMISDILNERGLYEADQGFLALEVIRRLIDGFEVNVSLSNKYESSGDN